MHVCASIITTSKMRGSYIGSEKRQRSFSSSINNDNVEAELTPFSFQLNGGGDELRGASRAYNTHTCITNGTVLTMELLFLMTFG